MENQSEKLDHHVAGLPSLCLASSRIQFSVHTATDNTSPPPIIRHLAHPDLADCVHPCSGPARPERRPAAASRQSLQACIASLPLQSPWMSKTYLKSDHFNGGGSKIMRSSVSQPISRKAE